MSPTNFTLLFVAFSISLVYFVFSARLAQRLARAFTPPRRARLDRASLV